MLLNEKVEEQLGVIVGMGEADYHALPYASASRLISMRRTPAHAYHRMMTPIDSKSLKLGSAIHCAILLPETFKQRYYVLPELNLRTTKGKEERDLACQNFGDRYVLTQEEAETCKRMAANAWNHPVIAPILKSLTHTETSLIWDDNVNLVRCKARLDGYCPELNAIVDLKTTRDASREGFQKSIYDYGYHIQAANYLRGAELAGLGTPDRFIFICLENEEPNLVAIYKLDDEAIDNGFIKLNELLVKWEQCTSTGIWPGYSDKIERISLPNWILKKEGMYDI